MPEPAGLATRAPAVPFPAPEALGAETVPLRLAGVVEDSIVDGPGLRLTLFTQGCPHGCPGCHNPETHPLRGGSLHSQASLLAR